MCESVLLINNNDNLSKQKHVVCQSTWSVGMHDWSTQKTCSLSKQTHVVYQNKSDVSDLEILYRYQLKVNCLSF